MLPPVMLLLVGRSIGNTGYTPVWLLCGEVGDRGHGPSTEVEGNSTHTNVDNTGY